MTTRKHQTKTVDRQENYVESDFSQSWSPIEIVEPGPLPDESPHPGIIHSDPNEVAKRVISILLTAPGVYLTFASSLVLFDGLVGGRARVFSLTFVITAFFIGTLLTVGGVLITKKRHFLLYFFVPIATVILGLLFMLAPVDLQGKLFGWISLILFPLVLFLFYAVKNFLEKIVDLK